MKSSTPIIAAIILGGAVLNILFLVLAVGLHARYIAEEGGLMENFQVFFAGASAIAFAVAARACPDRLLPNGLALLGLSFMLREVDIDNFGAPPLLVFFVQGTGRNVILGALWIWFGVSALRNFRAGWIALWAYWRTVSGRLLPVCALLLLTGALFDHGIVKGPYQMFIEEWVEFDAYFLYFLAGLIFRPAAARIAV